MNFQKGLVIACVSVALSAGFSGLAQAHGHRHHDGHHHGHYHHHKSCCHNVGKVKEKYRCCTTAKQRFAKCNGDYAAGCEAAHSYVTGSMGDHSKAWNEGFTDCRFNIYRSDKIERRMERREMGSCGRSRFSR